MQVIKCVNKWMSGLDVELIAACKTNVIFVQMAIVKV